MDMDIPAKEHLEVDFALSGAKGTASGSKRMLGSCKRFRLLPRADKVVLDKETDKHRSQDVGAAATSRVSDSGSGKHRHN